MIAAAPRRKANGEADIRPIRTGIEPRDPALVGGLHEVDGVGPVGGRLPAAQGRARRALPQPPPQRVPLGARGGGSAQRGERRGVRGLEDEVRRRAAGLPVQLHGTQYRRNTRSAQVHRLQRDETGGLRPNVRGMCQAPVSSPCPATHRAIAGATSSITTTRSTCTATTNATSTPEEIAVASTA